jgi:hypothetical protein
MKIEDLSTRELARLLGITQRAVEDLAKRGVVQRGERSGPIWSSRRSRLNCQHLREQWNTTVIVDTRLNPGVSVKLVRQYLSHALRPTHLVAINPRKFDAAEGRSVDRRQETHRPHRVRLR